MEQIRNQKVLQYRFWFRVIVLLASIGGCVLYAIYNNPDGTNFWGVVLGMAGSALVWSCVELVDFFVETNRQFTIERRQYFLMVGEYWSKLRNVFKSETDVERISWDDVMNIVDEITKQHIFPFKVEFIRFRKNLKQQQPISPECIGRYMDIGVAKYERK